MTAKTKVKGQTNTAPPWQPPEYEVADIYALQAMSRGEATQEQQLRFVKWLERATGVGEMSFRPGDEGRRDSDFAEGKRFVGLQFFTLAKAYLPSDNRRA